jgi:hypothetical protein
MRILALPLLFSCAVVCLSVCSVHAAEPATFVVPGHEREMQAMNDLYELHRQRAFSDCTLWDPWLPHSTLWSSQQARERYQASFLRRRIDSEGYVAMQQHRGMAHSDGWPFPAWQQSTGKGWHFSVAHDGWAVTQLGLKALTDTKGWQIEGATIDGIDPAVGLKLTATSDVISIITPELRCGTIVAPFLRIEWAARGLSTNGTPIDSTESGVGASRPVVTTQNTASSQVTPEGSRPSATKERTTGLSPESRPNVSWQFHGEETWQESRRVEFPAVSEQQGMQFANVPLYKQPDYAGLLARYRITIDKAKGASLTLKSVITAIDSRHPITNALYLRGCTEYFMWTKDIEFLRANIDRMRTAIRFALDEFSVQRRHHVVVPWVGHEGRSGLVLSEDGKKSQRPGLGVGNNYWDLLPFGGHDALATIYLFDALNRFIAIEKAIAEHPEWQFNDRPDALDPIELESLCESIRKDFQIRFWNTETRRFVGWIDLIGKAYDYGFTFVNLEAIHYGLASPDQASSIFDWLDGRREIAGDTARGADIYHWRFAPRATTKRNIETYAWMWSGPESIPWGGQVQDGGAVLGFSYFDVMSRLKSQGPDDAWTRLQEILHWFEEVQAEGGYRAYYAKPGRGTLQGGGTAGGLGLDEEFFESVLVPQVMLYGFLGAEPTANGLSLSPSLPKAWPSMTIHGIESGGYRLSVEALADGTLKVEVEKVGTMPFVIKSPTQSVTLLPADLGTTKVLAAGP